MGELKKISSNCRNMYRDMYLIIVQIKDSKKTPENTTTILIF
jgi:hypothetical protein